MIKHSTIYDIFDRLDGNEWMNSDGDIYEGREVLDNNGTYCLLIGSELWLVVDVQFAEQPTSYHCYLVSV